MTKSYTDFINENARGLSNRALAATPSLATTDEAAAAVQKTPNRVSLDSIKAKVAFVDYITPERHPHLMICLVTMHNGFVLIGETAPADPANYDAELAKQFSFENALKKAWPLEGYLLREQLAKGETDAARTG